MRYTMRITCKFFKGQHMFDDCFISCDIGHKHILQNQWQDIIKYGTYVVLPGPHSDDTKKSTFFVWRNPNTNKTYCPYIAD